MPVQVLNGAVREDIYHLALAAVQGEAGQYWPPRPLDWPLSGLRLAGLPIIKEWPGAPRTIIQAGSAQWPASRLNWTTA